jgi:hypothetical protein
LRLEASVSLINKLIPSRLTDVRQAGYLLLQDHSTRF